MEMLVYLKTALPSSHHRAPNVIMLVGKMSGVTWCQRLGRWASLSLSVCNLLPLSLHSLTLWGSPLSHSHTFSHSQTLLLSQLCALSQFSSTSHSIDISRDCQIAHQSASIFPVICWINLSRKTVPSLDRMPNLPILWTSDFFGLPFESFVSLIQEKITKDFRKKMPIRLWTLA